MAKAKSSVARAKGSWLYPISERGQRFFVLENGEEYPVSIDTYKMLVEDGRLSEDERWGLHINFLRIHRRDEVFIYTGDQDLGIVGYATVTEVYPEDRTVVLDFDIRKCKALLLKPVPAKIVRKWIPNPRAAVCSLSQFKADIYKRLPWNQRQHEGQDILATRMPMIPAGFGTPEMNRKVEKAAVNRVSRMYRSKGWSVISVEHKKLGFDLFCKMGTKVKKAEVKGVKGRTLGFLMTGGEFRKASEDSHFVLHVVIDALSKHPQVKTWTGKAMLRDFQFAPIQYQVQLKPESRSGSLLL